MEGFVKEKKGGKKEGRKEGRQETKKEGRQETKKEGRKVVWCSIYLSFIF